jgi:hypothetical protein
MERTLARGCARCGDLIALRALASNDAAPRDCYWVARGAS